MKLKSLHIDSYRHLQNINFDFTYPKGHEKFGQPLEKICIIGQSATGKTSILELIKDVFSKIDSIETLNGQSLFKHFNLGFDGHLKFFYNNKIARITKDKIYLGEQEYKNISNGSGSVGHLFDKGLRLIYLSSEIISKESINIFNQNPINILSDLSIDKYSGFNEGNINSNYIIEFLQNINSEIWFSLLYKILDYRKRFTQMASEIINKGAIADMKKLSNQYESWS
ncbi:MAG TPA: hypothetical protein VFI29_01440, partial [Hanamia sp.]|nr:hypothetical protein [Hanamia sp.]